MYNFLGQWVESMVDPELYSPDAPAEEFFPKMQYLGNKEIKIYRPRINYMMVSLLLRPLRNTNYLYLEL